jgi:hypothetical protein
LEKAVERLQQRNAELESEVHQLKSKSGPTAPSSRELSAEKRSKFVPDTKSYVETEVKPLVDVHPGGSEFKLTLGGYIQMNFESGDVSAFEDPLGGRDETQSRRRSLCPRQGDQRLPGSSQLSRPAPANHHENEIARPLLQPFYLRQTLRG